MRKATLDERLTQPAANCRAFAARYVEESLPREMRFRFPLNSSFDRNALHVDEVVFPQDHAPSRSRALRDCDAARVMSELWRGETCPSTQQSSLAYEVRNER